MHALLQGCHMHLYERLEFSVVIVLQRTAVWSFGKEKTVDDSRGRYQPEELLFLKERAHICKGFEINLP